MDIDKDLGPYLIIAVIGLSLVFIILIGVVLPIFLRKMMSKKNSKK